MNKRKVFSVTAAFILVTSISASFLLQSCNLVDSSSNCNDGGGNLASSYIITSPEQNLASSYKTTSPNHNLASTYKTTSPNHNLASTYIITSPEYNVRKATLIIMAEVQDIQYVESSKGISFAEMTLMVENRIVGNSPDVIKIRRPFVTPDLQFLDSEWLPTYKIGQRFITTLLNNSDNEIYTTLGLYNGKFIIENDVIQHTSITVGQFIQYIYDIRSNKIEKFPDELHRMLDYNKCKK